GAGDDDGSAVARLVGPDVPDPQGGVDHAGDAVRLLQLPVDGLSRLDEGAGALARQHDGNPHPRAVRAGSRVEAMQEVRHGPLLRLHRVDVRRLAVAGEDVDLRDELLGDVAVKIHAGGDDAARSDELTDRGGEVAL